MSARPNDVGSIPWSGRLRQGAGQQGHAGELVADLVGAVRPRRRGRSSAGPPLGRRASQGWLIVGERQRAGMPEHTHVPAVLALLASRGRAGPDERARVSELSSAAAIIAEGGSHLDVH